jgi:hypothetical protein
MMDTLIPPFSHCRGRGRGRNRCRNRCRNRDFHDYDHDYDNRFADNDTPRHDQVDLRGTSTKPNEAVK